MNTKETIEEIIEDTNETAYIKPEDWAGNHNVFSRLIIIVFMGILIYSFVLPLDIKYVEISSWLAFGVFILISVGINSLRTIGDIIIKIKK